MTRSSSSELVAPLKNPEHLFRKTKEETDVKEETEEKEERIMADVGNLSLEEYASRTGEGTERGITRPVIPADKSFEIKGQFLHLLRETPFTGRDDEDANLHVETVVEIADYFNIPGVSKDAVMLRVFPITLQGAAKRWSRSDSTKAITTWEQLKNSFIKQFSPPSKIAKKKMKIQNFQQTDDETLYDAWERYKEMLQNCPQHDLNHHQVMQTFYNGINVITRQLVDSQGPIPKKTPNDAKEIIEELAQHTHQWHSNRDPSLRKKSSEEGSESLSALNAKLDALSRDMKKVNQTIHSIQVGCDNCSGPHLTKDCQVNDDGSRKADICYSYGDRFDNRKLRNDWKPYDEYKKEMAEKYKQGGPGFYQKEQNFEQQRQTEKKPNFEELLARFAETFDKRQKETEELVKKLATNSDVSLRNQQASILNMEKQMGQMSRAMQERAAGKLPGDTETNPNAHVKAVETRSGKVLEPLVPVQTKTSSNVQEPEKTEQKKQEVTSEIEEKTTTPPPVKPYRPPIPFPERLRKEKQDEEYRKFLDHIKSLQINIPFVEAIAQMPKYAKFLKDLITNRKKMEAISSVVMNEQCSAAMLNRLPKKMTDPGSLTLPCQFGNFTSSHALADSGASVNLMPYSFYSKLNLPEPKPVRMAIHLANKSITYPRGVVEDLLVKIDKFVFPVDFIVLDMEEDEQVPIILGRPFLSTARALVDIHDSKLTLRVGTDAICDIPDFWVRFI